MSDSTDDNRTHNNAARHKYRQLTDAEKQSMADIKDMGAAFIGRLHELGCTQVGAEHVGSRNLTLARDHAEDAIMRAVRHITK